MIYKIVVLVLALCCSSSLGWAAERFPFLGEVSSDKVSIRAGYDVNFERVDIVPKGTQLLVLAKNYDWYQVQLPPSAKAYVRVDYVKMIDNKVGQINADRLNIRAGRGVNHSALGQLSKGVFVRLVSKFDDWLQIEPVEGLTGWVHKDFIKLKSQTVPSLDQLGLGPVMADTSIVDVKEPAAALKWDPSGAVVANGVIEPVSAELGVKNIQYQFTTEANAVYYLQIDPAVVGNFTRKVVRLEGDPAANAPASWAYPVLIVKKFSLVL
jgi:hypothetical protein